MKLAGVALLLALNAPLALAQGIVDTTLGAGWAIQFPGPPERQALEDDGQPGDGWSVATEEGVSYSALAGPTRQRFTGARAVKELERRVDAMVRRFGLMGDVKVQGVRRCDQGPIVGLEVRLSLRARRDGQLLRVHARLFQDEQRFVQATYIAPRDLYSKDMARWFLDSLQAGLPEEEPDVRAMVPPTRGRAR